MQLIKNFAGDVYRNRKIILSLALNDFKMRYAGSYLGIVWAFIQPIMTILVYWFVFQVGFRSGSVEKVP
ncbi:MAG: ABC transporter permease, partial [Paenibacillus macerans]|nr:ABC transporter permease [Paenibacillus macerans]